MKWKILLLLALISLPSMTAGWYSASWLYRTKLTIEHARVGATLTDYPVYVNLHDLGAGHNIWSHVKGSGADLRVTKADGVTEVPIEVVRISIADKNGEVHFKGSGTDINATTNADYYLYYGNNGASAYVTSATYGAQNVWDGNFKAVYHFQQSPNNGNVLDSTVNGITLTPKAFSGVGVTYDQMGASTQWAAASNRHMNGTLMSFAAHAYSFEMYIKPSATSNQTIWGLGSLAVMDSLNHGGITSNTAIYYNRYADDWALTGLTGLQSAWKYYVFTGTATTAGEIFKDGSSAGTHTYTSAFIGDGTFIIGNTHANLPSGANDYDGYITEFRISNSVRASTWISTVNNNLTAPASFYRITAEESAPAVASGASAMVGDWI